MYRRRGHRRARTKDRGTPHHRVALRYALIVACGGLHRKSDYPPDALTKTADQIAEDLVQQAKRERWGGIGEMGTGAAVPMDPVERKGLEAAAKAHLRTGLPIITHTSGGCARCALDQVDLFEKAGVDLQHVVIGHLNDIHDVRAAAPIAMGSAARTSASIIPAGRRSARRRARANHSRRAGRGLEDRCLSSDFGVNDEKSLRKNGGLGIDRILKTIVPRLKQAGVPQELTPVTSSAWTARA